MGLPKNIEELESIWVVMGRAYVRTVITETIKLWHEEMYDECEDKAEIKTEDYVSLIDTMYGNLIMHEILSVSDVPFLLKNYQGFIIKTVNSMQQESYGKLLMPNAKTVIDLSNLGEEIKK